jgi:branched-chain amino acid aminotransferase
LERELLVYINGQYYPKSQAKISVFDHGLLYGDGVFEEICAYGGSVFKLREHVDRLYQSAQVIMLEMPITKEHMMQAVLKTLQKNNLTDSYIRLIVTRGVGYLGIDPRKCSMPTIIVITDNILPHKNEAKQNGVTAMISWVKRDPVDATSHETKSLNYLNSILAKIEANIAGVDVAVCLDKDGLVCESTAENIFIVEDWKICAPPSTTGALSGITAKEVMKLAQKLGFDVREKNITPFELFNAEEVFLTGTASEITPVREINKRKIGKGKLGPITKRLMEEFCKIVKDLAQGTLIPHTPLEQVAVSGLEQLGYKMVESTIATPSGSSTDFVMKQKGNLVGVEVKARNVEPTDLKGAIDVKSALGFSNIIVVSSKKYQNETSEFAKKHGIELVTIDDILKEVKRTSVSPEARARALILERDISNWMQFVQEQQKPQERLLKEFGTMFEACLSAETNDEKKRTLETLGAMLVEMIEGLKVVDMNVITKTEEIDILVKNESRDPFWQRFSTPFLVECKNWSKPVGASEIRDFDGKKKEIHFRIMIAINGITGKNEREDARGVVRDALKEGRIVIVLDKKDLEDIAKGTSPADKIEAKYYELYRL